MPKQFMGVDQWGNTYHNIGPHPRKALLERLGRKKASKMYMDKTDGSYRHVGWVIAGQWISVYEVKVMEGEP